jgi:dethiobiotin synthetase
VVLVARNGLGTISHTALAVQEIRRRNVDFLGTILVTTTSLAAPDQQTNLSLISSATGQSPLGTLPFLDSQRPADIAKALMANVNLHSILKRLAI